MICSICQTEGHNRQTCSVVVRYEYDDCGVKCRINPNDEGDYQPVEPYCLPCGAKTEECDCGKYKCGKWFNEEKGKFQGAPRRSSPRPKKITPKPACFACGQVETECRLEITEQGKTLCCDCLYIENHPDATCHRCDKKLYSKTLVLCGGGDGECETWYCATCHADGTHDCPVCGDDDETVSVVSDCELPCPDCRRWFDEGKDNCKSCDFDLNSFNKPPSPTRDQLIALGKYKLAKFQIGKSEQKDETNWNEDGDDELCSAIDASGNALY